MYISEVRIENFRCFGEAEHGFLLTLGPGLTALVGENDSGKTAVVDALRFALGTRDQEYMRVGEHEFHWAPGEDERRREIRIRCKFGSLTANDKAAFAEYLTYAERDGKRDPVLYLNWTARDTPGTRGHRRFVSVDMRSGERAEGPVIDSETRTLLRGTYLRPLRDAQRAMTAGRGSRLSQILQYTHEVQDAGTDYDRERDPEPDPRSLSVLGVGDYASALLGEHTGIKAAMGRLNKDYLKHLSFSGDDLTGDIAVSTAGDSGARLRQLLEKLELSLKDDESDDAANRGLGSNNLLFMACELLLLRSEADDLPLLLIEEPEAHLHPQRQLRLMQFLRAQTSEKREDGQTIQVIVTTHSPNLASAIKLENLTMIEGGRAFPLSSGKTRLEGRDYRFLERFLDVTKSNLFFARGVVIVEGDGETLLVPTLARIIGRDFDRHGVSVVNVGHTGLRRYARVFQRSDPETDGVLDVPVACIADMDVMPDCAPPIVGKVREDDAWPENRNWRVKSDFTAKGLVERRKGIREKASGQNVDSFVSDEWTLEYDLAYAGLAEDVWIAAHLARKDDQINVGNEDQASVATEAERQFSELNVRDLPREELAARVYALFTTGTKASKSVAAQYLAERLERKADDGYLAPAELEARMPTYLRDAIYHVTGDANSGKGGDEAAADS